jgi:DNA-binding NtrC family response regulator
MGDQASDSPPRILVIDDDESVRRSMVRLLARVGYLPHGAANGDTGLQWLRANGADLVITDMQMPGKTGLEVLLELRACNPRLPVIAVSGGDLSRQLDLLGSAGLLGAVAMLLKPFTVDELTAAVRSALERAAA